jgi:hypothetical protein
MTDLLALNPANFDHSARKGWRRVRTLGRVAARCDTWLDAERARELAAALVGHFRHRHKT